MRSLNISISFIISEDYLRPQATGKTLITQKIVNNNIKYYVNIFPAVY
jgi:hypothetical protein